jgi:hypothetical protein
MKRISIINIPEISAVYYALLQCGYDYYALDKDAGLIAAIENFRTTANTEFLSFFSKIKQNRCEVYPYWPRAAMLETAVYYIDSNTMRFGNFSAYKKDILSAGNIADAERNQDFWGWIDSFPAALGKVLEQAEFRAYFGWETQWISEQNRSFAEDLLLARKIVDVCKDKYSPAIQNIAVVLNPIKCAYSADYHIIGNELLVSSGAFRLDSILHEYIHQLIHPAVTKCKNAIINCCMTYAGIDESYYLAGNEGGKVNACEEYIARKLTGVFLALNFPDNLDKYVTDNIFSSL